MRFLRLCTLLVLLAAAPGAGLAGEPGALPREVLVNGVELVLIPSGWFWYSVSVPERARLSETAPIHRDARVWLDGFYLAKYEARARDFARFLNSGAASPEALGELGQRMGGLEDEPRKREPCTVRRDPDGRWRERDGSADLPATDLSWALASEFAAWMGLRLPAEAEWQKGARGIDRRSWPWGDAYPDDTYGLFGWSTQCEPAPVTAYPKGRSPYGLYNMAGNVAEYTADWFNQDFDDGIKDGVRNPPLAAQGTLTPYEPPLKISKDERWSRDIIGHRIMERRLLRPYRMSNFEGARFAADVATVRAHLARGTARIMESK